MAEFDFQKQYYEQLDIRLSNIESDIKDIKGKVMYMYGAAAGIGLLSSFIIDWVRTHITGH